MTFYKFQYSVNYVYILSQIPMPSSCKHRILEHRMHKLHFQAPSRGARTRSPSLACDVKKRAPSKQAWYLFYDPYKSCPHLYNISVRHLLWHLSYLWRPATLKSGIFKICQNMGVHDIRMHQRMVALVPFQYPTCFRFFENFGLAILNSLRS